MRSSSVSFRCSSLGDFMTSASNREHEISAFEIGLLPRLSLGSIVRRLAGRPIHFTVPGFCEVCEIETDFLVSCDPQTIPNWREGLTCPHCRLNNRMRAAVGFVLSRTKPNASIYLTERITQLFPAVAKLRPDTVGSEYLRDGTPSGTTNHEGVRHEDATNLSFPSETFDAIGTFDVLEHIPSYRKALGEFFRCLKPGGTLIVTVPFLLRSPTTVTRATVGDDGAVRHILPPEIHGDPINQDGALCFYHFGWDLLASLTDVGFDDAEVVVFWNPALGHLGGYQHIITASRSHQNPIGPIKHDGHSG